MDEQEDALELKFGGYFKDGKALMNDEVLQILEDEIITEETVADTNEKTLSYVKRLSRFKNKKAIGEVRKILEEHGFEGYEAAAFANLCVDEGDATVEAIKWQIPTLERYNEEDLETICKMYESWIRET